MPLGVPKLMVSTLASGQVRRYVEPEHIDAQLGGRHSGAQPDQSRGPRSAARAMAGLVLQPHNPQVHDDRPLIAASMFGVTTPCVEAASHVLTAAGYEVLVFHATGIGGQAMESLIADGLIAGVLDITTTELADELVGGVLSAGPDRLTAAAGPVCPRSFRSARPTWLIFTRPKAYRRDFRSGSFISTTPTSR